jgi:hypothetical protein
MSPLIETFRYYGVGHEELIDTLADVPDESGTYKPLNGSEITIDMSGVKGRHTPGASILVVELDGQTREVHIAKRGLTKGTGSCPISFGKILKVTLNNSKR